MRDYIEFSRFVNSGNLRAIKTMVKNGYKIEKDRGISFLYAIEKGHLSVVKYLLSKNIHYSLNNIFRCAVLNGQTDIFKYFYNHVGVKDKRHAEKLYMTACCHGYFKIIKFLYSQGVNLRTESDRALYLAAAFAKFDIFKYLLSKGLKLDKYNNTFKASIENKDDTISQFIIEKQDNLSIIDKLLTYSSKANKLDSVKLLISKGGDIKIAKKYGNQEILNFCTDTLFQKLQQVVKAKDFKSKLIKI